ncbi:PREDICTED: importin-4-like isoform X1 [Drosophila arizonae]|uniref:Importin-4-like isoform X1 n=1 Tax=Drosophila arizonae TaxID=7263 RepID=A0ABM1P507_DROAR|nr:PREDICTED: importin-4-like isoform X1 [Drosophila arizonae]
MDIILDEIIAGLLCTDTERIRQATSELGKAYENPETLNALCQIIVSQREPQVRQFAAVLLNKRLQKLRNWQMVPANQKESIKTGMLQALIAEKEKSVKNAIAQFIGSLVRHEEEKKDSWLAELLNFIYSRCNVDDPKESELGSSIFATLTDAAPDQFVSHMDSICQMFAAVLMSAEAKGNLSTPTVANITMGMSYLMPFVSGHTSAEQTVLKILPLIIKTVFAFAQKGDEQEFCIVFDVIDSIAEYVPKLLNNNVKHLMEFCLETANNKQIDDSIRVQVVTFIGRVVRIKKKAIVKQKLLEPIIAVIFEMMCCETELDDVLYLTDELFTGESSNSPVTAATQTLDLLAINLSPEKLIPPLLQLLEPALQSPDPLRRRAAYLCIAVIAEGCSEAICNKYLEVMLNIVKSGIADNSPIVRIASFFALGQFSEHLQPEISRFAPQILPVLFDFLQQLVIEIKSGNPEPKHTDRMFYALENYCQNLEEDIVPHLPLLMSRLFDTLDTNNSIHLRVLGLSAVSATALAAREHLMPYFPKIVEILKNYLVKECSEEMKELRNEAIDTLASITRVVGKDNFIPLANDTMAYCLMMLDDGPNDPDFRRAIYNLIGALSIVVKESMSTVFPKIIDRLIESVISTEDMLPINDENGGNRLFNGEAAASNIDIDLDNTDDEDDDDEEAYQVENDYVFEKEEAILALKELAMNTGSAFAPYLQTSFENVYKVIEHQQENIRKSAIEAIAAFVSSLYKMGDAEGVKRACLIIMPKFAHMIREDEDQGVVIHLLDMLSDIFVEVKSAAVPTQEIGDMIFACIKDVLNNKMACQFNEPSGGGDEEEAEDSEFDELLIENAGNLLPSFGKALTPEIFSMYFGRVYQYYLNKLNKAKRNDLSEQRTFVYGALADSFQSLGVCVATYFDELCPVFVDGVNDPEPKARQNCYFGLGELVLHAEEKSFESFHVILQALSGAIASETNAPALDNICGAVSRMIVTNHNIVPLAQVLPVLLSHLPLREDMDENDMVHKAFRVLYMHARPAIVEYIEQILKITIDVLYKDQIPEGEIKMSSRALILEIREQYPDQFNNVANSSQEAYNFLQSL